MADDHSLPLSETPGARSQRLILAGSLLTGLSVAAILLATSPMLPMTWDEGNAINRAAGIGQGQWQYTTQMEGHPAFYGIVIFLGQALSSGWLPPLASARLGPILLFGVASGAMFWRLASDYSLAAGLTGTAALVIQPRLFAHAHFAGLDGTLSACWVLAWAFFPVHGERWRAAGWGILLGLTMGAKATGWLAPLPFLAWAAVRREWVAWRTLAIGLPVALAAFYAVNPPLWSEPVQGLLTFFDLNRHRHGFNVTTQFLGQMYDLHHPLPWYNTIFWTLATVPVGVLVLSGFGTERSLRTRGDRGAALLLIANWLVLLIIRALPLAPPHDGERLILPSFAMLAALAGIGGARIIELAGAPFRKHAIGAVAALCAGSATSVAWYAPQWLSYYSLLVGGLPGATSLGMEPTYYWDGLDRSVLCWLDANSGPQEKIHFSASSRENLALLRQWGVLTRDFQRQAPGRYRWYVLQRRPSAMLPFDLWLVDRGQPAFQKKVRSGGWGPWRLDVPIVEVYPFEQYVQAVVATWKK